VITTLERAKVRMFRFPLDGGMEKEITTDGSVPMTGLVGNLNAEGRLLVGLSPLDSWFFVPGVVDINTGRITRLPTDEMSSTNSLSWTADGQIVEIRQRFRSALWRFQAVGK
jgi:hypothetical protein